MENTAFTTKSSAPEMTRKILFIVNPNAGKKISEQVISIIKRGFPKEIQYQIIIWSDKNNFEEIDYLIHSGHFTEAVAVGGDGTVNRVAKSLLGKNMTLGIVPVGSGNGLARTLGLSMKTEEVIKQIADGKKQMMDVGMVNGRPFLCTSGIGFDAHIGNLFATSAKRGLQSYVKITVSELFRYRAKTYTLKLNGKEITRKAFLITVANSGQYGNDFYIAPQASIQDGLFHIAILKPFNPINVWAILAKILRRRAHLSSSIETHVASELSIIRQNSDTIHFDGEPAMESPEVIYKNMHSALSVIVGEKFKTTQHPV